MFPETVLSEFKEKVLIHLTPRKSDRVYNGNVLRKNSGKLSADGDFSFPGIIIDDESEKVQSLIEVSQDWPLAIRAITPKFDRFNIFLDRRSIIEKMVPSFLGSTSEENVSSIKIPIQVICPRNLADYSVTELRKQMFCSIVQNLIKASKTHKLQDADGGIQAKKMLIHTQKQNGMCVEVATSPDCIRLMCGPALDADTKHLFDQMTDREYIEKRTTDMMQAARHKYGDHVNLENGETDFRQLGRALVVLELMKVKQTSSVKLCTRTQANGAGDSTKRDSFILYNSARVETLLRQHEQKVTNGEYKPLPPIEHINFGLLIEEEEWQLVFNFMLEKGAVVARTLAEMEAGRVGVHLICNFLGQLSNVFSGYYKRIRILTPPKNQQLVALMNARIYLMQCIRSLFRECLGLLTIEPICTM